MEWLIASENQKSIRFLRVRSAMRQADNNSSRLHGARPSARKLFLNRFPQLLC
jgi:hypothetical protein